MLRDLLSSRWFQRGLVFFLLVVGGSLLYSWHVLRTTESDMERHDQLLQGRENKKDTRPAETVNVPTENETPGLVNTPDQNTDTPMPAETEALPNEGDDFADAFLPEDFVSEEVPPAEDDPVSPFGFGPYPEIPTDYPQNLSPSWTWSAEEKERSSNLLTDELMDRVLIQLWNQGEKGIIGGSTGGSRVYPHYPKTVYATYENERLPNGTAVQRISTMFGGPDITEQEMQQIHRYGEAPGITILDAADTGINPYTFLTLERK